MSDVRELTFYAGTPTVGSDGAAVCIYWHSGRPDRCRTVGPFLTRSAAQAWGRQHFPRRHRVVGLASPEDVTS